MPIDAAETRALLAQALELHKALRLTEAEAIYRRILANDPQHADALHLLGMTQLFRGQPQQAHDLIRAAIDADPLQPAFHSNLALALKVMERRDEAMTVIRRVLSAHPDFATAHYVLATLLNEAGDSAGCYEACARAVQLDPGNVAAHVLMSASAVAIQRPADARLAAERAIALDPANSSAHWNLALALLVMGEFDRGWREYEWRFQRYGYGYLRRPFVEPMWDGTPLAGKRILLHAEGGLGDAIMFARYAPMVARVAGEVILECPPSLRELFSTLAGVGQVIARGEALPEFDCHCPLQGLPLRFGTTLSSLPADVPYLSADPARLRRWRDRLDATAPPGRRIGLVWFGSGNQRDRRSRSLDVFTPLADLPGITFVSLQKGADTGERARSVIGRAMIDFTDDLHDFADTAALIANLDLAISVDTSVAHLAGAMAKPTFVLIPRIPDFRWLLERADSPWYPTMRLFRQREANNWREPVAAIREALVSEK